MAIPVITEENRAKMDIHEYLSNTPELEKFVKDSLASGVYKSEGELLREALRALLFNRKESVVFGKDEYLKAFFDNMPKLDEKEADDFVMDLMKIRKETQVQSRKWD